jgi:hypothetical protein
LPALLARALRNLARDAAVKSATRAWATRAMAAIDG